MWARDKVGFDQRKVGFDKKVIVVQESTVGIAKRAASNETSVGNCPEDLVRNIEASLAENPQYMAKPVQILHCLWDFKAWSGTMKIENIQRLYRGHIQDKEGTYNGMYDLAPAVQPSQNRHVSAAVPGALLFCLASRGIRRGENNRSSPNQHSRAAKNQELV